MNKLKNNYINGHICGSRIVNAGGVISSEIL